MTVLCDVRTFFRGWSIFVGLYILVAHLTQLAPPRSVLDLLLVPTLTPVLGHHHDLMEDSNSVCLSL